MDEAQLRAVLEQTLQAEREKMRQEFAAQMQDMQMRTALAERESTVSRELLASMAAARPVPPPSSEELRELKYIQSNCVKP